MPVVFSKYFKRLPLVFKSYHLYLNLVILVVFILLTSFAQVSRSRVIAQNTFSLDLEEVLVVAEQVKDEQNVDEIEGVVRGVAASVEEVKPAVNAQSESIKRTDVLNDNKALCKDVEEDWKMIPDPAHSGQYIICNTASEQMTTASELNAAQNSYRTKHGLNALNINAELCNIAANRAVEVSKNFSHDGFKSAVEGSGVGKSSYGENIASGPLSGVHFVEWSWDKSPGHRENMLGDWTDGCGGVHDKYAVFLFAK